MAAGDDERGSRFQAVVWPHANAAFNLARWICRHDADAADIVQESFVRALQYFPTYRGGDARAWLLAIVRNTAHTWLAKNRRPGDVPGYDFDDPSSAAALTSPDDPMSDAMNQQSAQQLRRLIARLPLEQREVLVLREFEDLSYKQIALVVGTPMGTVMSRLARARDALADSLQAEQELPP